MSNNQENSQAKIKELEKTINELKKKLKQTQEKLNLLYQNLKKKLARFFQLSDLLTVFQLILTSKSRR